MFSRGHNTLEQIASAMISGTVELEVFALAYCMTKHCKCFLSALGFMVFFLHVARALPLEYTSSACTTLVYVNTAVYPSALATNP